MKILITLIVNYSWAAIIAVAIIDMTMFVRKNCWGHEYFYSSKMSPGDKRCTLWLAIFCLTLLAAGLIKGFVFQEYGYKGLFFFSPLVLGAVYVIVDYFFNKETPW